MLRQSEWIKDAALLKVSVVGLKAFQKVGRYMKPTTRFIQLFGHMATKGYVCISEEQLFQLVSGMRLSLSLNLEDGYVILKLDENKILGMGLWTKGTLQSQIPKKEIRWEYKGRVIKG